MEGDALTVIKKLRSVENDRSVIGNIIKEIKDRIPKFRSLSFRHVSRMANETAHGLETRGRRYDSSVYWIEEVPAEVEHLIIRDRRGFQTG